MEDYKICHECGNKMYSRIIDKNFRFHGKDITIKDTRAFVCEKCGSVVYELEEAKKIYRLCRVVED